MKWLLWGSKGWIGEMVCAILEERGEQVYHASSRADADAEVLKEIETIQPDRIMSFIGRTHGGGHNTIDYLEQPGVLPINIRDNLYAPMILATIASKLGIHYTYLGTGCIFEFKDVQNPDLQNGFGPDALPAPAQPDEGLREPFSGRWRNAPGQRTADDLRERSYFIEPALRPPRCGLRAGGSGDRIPLSC